MSNPPLHHSLPAPGETARGRSDLPAAFSAAPNALTRCAADIASAPPEERCHGGMLPVHHYARYLKERSGTCRLQSTGLAAAAPCTRGYAAPHVSNKPQTAGAGLFSLILQRFITAPTLHSPLNWKTWGSPRVLSLREASPPSVAPGIRPRPPTRTMCRFRPQHTMLRQPLPHPRCPDAVPGDPRARGSARWPCLGFSRFRFWSAWCCSSRCRPRPPSPFAPPRAYETSWFPS